MNNSQIIKQNISHYNRLKDELVRRMPELAEDETTLLDTLEGLTNVDEILSEVIRSARQDEALVQALDIQLDHMRARRERIKSRTDKKRSIVCESMLETGIKKIEAPDFTLSLKRVAPQLVITNENILPASFLNTKTINTPDRTAIKRAIASGEIVAGALLGNAGHNISVRTK